MGLIMTFSYVHTMYLGHILLFFPLKSFDLNDWRLWFLRRGEEWGATGSEVDLGLSLSSSLSHAQLRSVFYTWDYYCNHPVRGKWGSSDSVTVTGMCP
jgi:hypothetical protein